jgi:hypothetical protein
MHQRLLWVALVAGCGSVQSTPPPDGMPDGSPPGVDLTKGCIYKAAMDEAAWPATGKPVLDACGDDLGMLTGSGAAPAMDSTRGRVGSFSNNACIEVASSPALHATTTLTMAAWIHPIALDNVTSNGIIDKRIDKNDESEYGMFVWTGNRVWIDLGDSDRYEGTTVIQDNVWTQVTAVFDGAQPAASRVQLYINGASDLVSHPMIGTLGATLPSYDSPLHIGCTPAPSAAPPTQQTFQGQLDDVTIWNRVLGAAEIAALSAPR